MAKSVSLSPNVKSNKLLVQERRAAASLSAIYGVRMLGLFIILPVFSVSALEYQHSTPMLIGLALGMYGLLQAILQVPFGMLSDRIGRKPVILMGLVLFLLGSVIAAMADSIYTVIVGRALQGAGAVSAALIALAADLTRDEQRTKMMATLGGSIGFAFVLSLVLGPLLVNVFSLDGLFWFTAFSAVCAMVLLVWVVPTPARAKISGDTVANVKGMRALLADSQLIRLDLSIFVLHALVTASFIGLPAMLTEVGLPLVSHWKVYLPALLLSVVVMVPLIIIAEKHKRLRFIFLLSIVGIATAQTIFLLGHQALLPIFLGIAVFFSFFNTLEALLPSLVSKLAPPGVKGSAMGIYSSAQFLGAFFGGVGGGWLYGYQGFTGLCVGLIVLCILWVVAAYGLSNPKPVSSYLFAVGHVTQSQGVELAKSCLALSGVEDAVVVPNEGVAYLKIDRKRFDAEQLSTIALPSGVT